MTNTPKIISSQLAHTLSIDSSRTNSFSNNKIERNQSEDSLSFVSVSSSSNGNDEEINQEIITKPLHQEMLRLYVHCVISH